HPHSDATCYTMWVQYHGINFEMQETSIEPRPIKSSTTGTSSTIANHTQPNPFGSWQQHHQP
ncbi:MAG: hypothetical protein VYA84_05680, partial [Planctomycetota bacterium]|nr:hypothetical protein [Planctomycetota bacterium]